MRCVDPLHVVDMTLGVTGLRLFLGPRRADHAGPLGPSRFTYASGLLVTAEHLFVPERIACGMHHDEAFAGLNKRGNGLFGGTAPTRAAVVAHQNIVGSKCFGRQPGWLLP